VGYLLLPSIAEDALGEEVVTLRRVLEEAGATVVGEGTPALRLLAYPIRKGNREGGITYTSAYFGSLRFEVIPEQAPLIKQAFDKNTSLLRFLIMKTVRELLMPARTHEPRATSAQAAEVTPVDHKELTDSDKEQIEKGIEDLLVEETTS